MSGSGAFPPPLHNQQLLAAIPPEERTLGRCFKKKATATTAVPPACRRIKLPPTQQPLPGHRRQPQLTRGLPRPLPRSLPAPSACALRGVPLPQPSRVRSLLGSRPRRLLKNLRRPIPAGRPSTHRSETRADFLRRADTGRCPRARSRPRPVSGGSVAASRRRCSSILAGSFRPLPRWD